jgi:transketolase
MDKGGRGHLASAFSLVEIMQVLYDDILRVDPSEPSWKERDRCILSKGHGCLALYAVLADKGFFPEEELWSFCKKGALLGGHPEKKIPGVEASTGSLGHGLPIGVGMALAGKLSGKDWKTYVIMGDGECNEGSVWEAAMSASKHGLSNLTVIVDYNKLQSYGPVDTVQPLEPFADKWLSFGFDPVEVDGHSHRALRRVFEENGASGKPRAVICHTVKGKGVSFVENNPSWHHKNKLTQNEIDALMRELEVTP